MLENSWLYLALNALCIAFPLMKSFDSRVSYYQGFRSLFSAIAIVGAFFLVWDVLFTELGIWGFTPDYLSGIYLFGLPLGEYLFFITVPFSCLFIYKVVPYYYPNGFISNRLEKNISNFLFPMFLTLGIFGALNAQAYTASTFLLLSAFFFYVWKIAKVQWLGRFYEAYLFILVPFFLMNGILTGTFLESQVVWYDDTQNLGIRMGTIPFEDTFYGMLLILGNVYFYEKFEAARKSRLK
jgi:lycopene cyclase domain-containing protein